MNRVRQNWGRPAMRWRQLALLVVLLAILCLVPLAGADCASAGPGADVSIPTCDQGPDGIPYGPALTFTEKPFWIVLGLVVLGWLVLAADWPEEGR